MFFFKCRAVSKDVSFFFSGKRTMQKIKTMQDQLEEIDFDSDYLKWVFEVPWKMRLFQMQSNAEYSQKLSNFLKNCKFWNTDLEQQINKGIWKYRKHQVCSTQHIKYLSWFDQTYRLNSTLSFSISKIGYHHFLLSLFH